MTTSSTNMKLKYSRNITNKSYISIKFIIPVSRKTTVLFIDEVGIAEFFSVPKHQKILIYILLNFYEFNKTKTSSYKFNYMVTSTKKTYVNNNICRIIPTPNKHKIQVAVGFNISLIE